MVWWQDAGGGIWSVWVVFLSGQPLSDGSIDLLNVHAWKEQAEVIKISLRFQVILVMCIMVVRFKRRLTWVCVRMSTNALREGQ